MLLPGFTGKFAPENALDNLVDFQRKTYCQVCMNMFRNLCTKYGKDFETVLAPDIVDMWAQEAGLEAGHYILMPNGEFYYA